MSFNFAKWKRAFAPYEKIIEKFTKSKGLVVEKYYHDGPLWLIWKQQGIQDFGIWWSIQLLYNEG